jgi:homoserine kinase type II
MNVFLLWHAQCVEEELNVKLIGVYSSYQNAVDARERVRDKPGFRDYPNGFCIDRYQVDKDWWPEGFETIR